VLRGRLLAARLICATHGRAVAVGLLAVGLLAVGASGWVVTHPGTETVTEPGHVRTVGTSGSLAAVVTDDSPLYDRGTRLENGSVFLRAGTGDHTLRQRASLPEGKPVEVTQSLTLEVRAVRDGTAFWSERETLARRTATVRDGNATLAAGLDIDGLAGRLDRIENELRGVGRVRVRVHSAVAYDTGRYAGTLRAAAPLSVGDRAVSLEGALHAERTHTTPVVTAVSSGPNYLGSAVLALFGLGSAGVGVAVWRRRNRVDPAAVERRRQRLRNAEWISRGELPARIDRTAVRIDSLQDLVDLAIDTDGRVVEDPERELYAVLADGVRYYVDVADGRTFRSGRGMDTETRADVDGGEARGGTDADGIPEELFTPGDRSGETGPSRRGSDGGEGDRPGPADADWVSLEGD
jgi:hypothetical protein